jgi:HPt (histidine-containing phosphotransfer) domain-containing protein
MRENFGEDFDEVLDTFLDDAPDLLARLRESLAGDARDELSRHAHSLKSAARSFSLTRVAALAESLEKTAHSDAAADLSARVEALEQTYAEDGVRLRTLCGRGPATA